jgi:hypothetical protein
VRLARVSAEPRIVNRSERVLVALATFGALFCVASLAYGVTRVPLVRDVAFSGVDHRSGPACHGPALWNGERAWVTCDWRHAAVRTLVEFDPETARATVLHRWSRTDGDTPALQVVRPCPDGLLFASPVWLIAFIALRGRSPRPPGLVIAAGVYILLFLCGAEAYLGALAWI